MLTERHVAPAHSVAGRVEIGGDKSISHRALMIAAISSGPCVLSNLSPAADVRATVAALRELDVEIDYDADAARCTVHGVGRRGIVAGDVAVDAANSGTLARLLCGLMAGQTGSVMITGDESLTRRPMRRVADPLRQMGARIQYSPKGTLPLTVTGSDSLVGIEYEMPVASAQIQSALLLAALNATGTTTLHEPYPVRDHTERLLRRAGVSVQRRGRNVTLQPASGDLRLPDTQIPGDMSAAAPLIVAATLLRESRLSLPGVGVNPSRLGLHDTFDRMGISFTTLQRRTVDGEPVADVDVTGVPSVHCTRPRRSDVPRMIDELPLLGLVAQFCKGETRVRGAEELRYKESDRVASTVLALRKIGINAEEQTDGFVVRGSGTRPHGGTVHTEGDHRIAMLAGVAGLVSRHGVTVVGSECVDVSFPGFFEVLERLARR